MNRITPDDIAAPRRRSRLWLGSLGFTVLLLTLAAIPGAVAAALAARDADPITIGFQTGGAAVLAIAVAMVIEGRWLR